MVVVEVEAGNDLIDSGVMHSTRELRAMLGGQKFRAFANGEQRGHINWSKSMMTGFTGVFSRLGVQPGDTVLLSFSPGDGDMIAELATV